MSSITLAQANAVYDDYFKNMSDLRPEYFGAKGTGDILHDDSVPFQAMIDEWRKGEKPVCGGVLNADFSKLPDGNISSSNTYDVASKGIYRIHNIQWKGLIDAPEDATLITPRRLKIFDLSNAVVINENDNQPMFLHPLHQDNLRETTIRIGSIISGPTAGAIWLGRYKDPVGGNDSNPTVESGPNYNMKPGIVASCTLDFGYVLCINKNWTAIRGDWGNYSGPTSFIDCRFEGNNWINATGSTRNFLRIETGAATMNDNVFSPKRVTHRGKPHFFYIACTSEDGGTNFHNRFDGINFQTKVNEEGEGGGGLIALYGQRTFEIDSCIVWDSERFREDQIVLGSAANGPPCRTGVIRNYRRRNDSLGPDLTSQSPTMIENGVYDLRIDYAYDIVIEHSDCGVTTPLRVFEAELSKNAENEVNGGAVRIGYFNTIRANRFTGPDGEEAVAVSPIESFVTDSLKTQRRVIGPMQEIPANSIIQARSSYIRFISSGDVVSIKNAMRPDGTQIVSDGERLTLTVAGVISGDVVVNLKDDNAANGGNIRLSGGSTITLDSNNDVVELMYEGTLAAWVPVSEAAQR